MTETSINHLNSVRQFKAYSLDLNINLPWTLKNNDIKKARKVFVGKG